MATIRVEENSGPGVDYTDLATAADNAQIGDSIEIRGSWTNADPGGPVRINKNGVSITAIGAAATNGVVDEVSGTYWRLLYTGGSKHALHSVADNVSFSGLTVKLDHSTNNLHAIHVRKIASVSNCVCYGPSSSSAEDQHAVAVEQGLQDYDVSVSNLVAFKLNGSGVHTEWASATPVMTGKVVVKGSTFSRLRAGVRRAGAAMSNDIKYYQHSNLYHDCTSLAAEEASVLADHFADMWVDNCIASDAAVINASFSSNVNSLGSQAFLHQSPTSTGVLLQNRDTYPYDFNLFPATIGDNVAVDHHSSITQVQGFFNNTLLSNGIGGVLRNPSAVDAGAFELVTTATGNVTQDAPFLFQTADGAVDVRDLTLDTIGPFLEQSLSGQDIVTGSVTEDTPFIDQDAAGQVILQITGTSLDYILPFINQDAAGVFEGDLEGDITQNAPFIDQDIVAAGFRIFQLDTLAPFIDIQASTTTILQGNITEDLPFVDQDAAGAVQTVSSITQDAPFIDIVATGEVTLISGITQTLPWLDQKAYSQQVWSVSVVNTFAPFIDQDAISTANVLGNIPDQLLPFLQEEDEPGTITFVSPFLEIAAVGEAAQKSGDITQDLPFVEQAVIGGNPPPIIGDIPNQAMPFLDDCLWGLSPRAGDISQDLPFVDQAAAGLMEFTGPIVQDAPFLHIDMVGPGAVSDEIAIRVCIRLIILQATERFLRLLPRTRGISITAIRRRAIFVCAVELIETNAVVVESQWLGGTIATWMDGSLVEYLVEDE